jgi:hypothetical protein
MLSRNFGQYSPTDAVAHTKPKDILYYVHTAYFNFQELYILLQGYFEYFVRSQQ